MENFDPPKHVVRLGVFIDDIFRTCKHKDTSIYYNYMLITSQALLMASNMAKPYLK